MSEPRTNERRGVSHGVAALWASAFVIAALTLTQAARLPVAGAQTQAGTVSRAGELTVLSADTGAGEDVLVILDDVDGSLLVYGVQNRNSVELIQAYNVARLFADAR